MRRKKHKHTRKGVAFYKVNYGFKEPFKVLLDGNFIHTTLEANMTPLEEHLPKLLGAPAKLYTTRCVVAELRQLGPDMAPAAQVARILALHKCGHDTAPLTPADCLLSAVGGANASHWWVATQDRALAAQLAGMPGAPRVFASANGLHLADPPERAQAHVAAVRAANLAVPRHELASGALQELPALRPRDDGWKKFRRKRAKAPNPLSVRKKKPKPRAEAAATAAAAQQREEGEHKKRRRKKAKGGTGKHGASEAGGE